MAKITLSNILSGFNLQRINENFQRVQGELNDKVLYRSNPDNDSNSMNTNLDMNSFRILNLRAPTNPNEPARLKDIQDAIIGNQLANIIKFDPTTTITADNVQDAIEQLDDSVRSSIGNVNLFFLAGEADHTGMFSRAIAAGRRVYVPRGTYIVDSVALVSNCEIFGDGDSSIIQMKSTSAYAFFADSGSSDKANNLKSIRINNVQIVGTVATDGFSEHCHLVSLNGVSNVVLENVVFKGFRGDGVYIGSGAVGGQERHNENVVISRCRFDGVNNDNRNGVSFIDIDGAVVEGCTFKNCTRPGQPGPIDFEPDANAFHIIRNITVRRNKFDNNGGGVAEVSVFVPAAVTAAPVNILVENNVSTNYKGTGYFFFFSDNRAPTVASDPNDIKLLYNNVKNGNGTFGLFTGKDILVDGNVFSDIKSTSFLGYNEAATKVRDVTIVDNRFVRCGSVNGNALSIFQADYITFTRNRWIDCGTGSPGASNAIDFNTGSSSYIVFDSNEFSAPTGKGLVAIQKEAAHNFSKSTNRYLYNVDNGLGNTFLAEESDTLESTYTPIIAGASVAGVSTPSNGTSAYGKYHRVGKTVFFTVEWIGTSTGSGLIQVSLPLPMKANNNNQLKTVVASTENVPSVTSSPIGLINPAAVVNGVSGAVRIYYSTTGTAGQATIPAGTFTVRASGFYETT